MDNMVEFVIEWVKGQKVASVTFPGGTRFANRLLKLAKENPDEVDVLVNKDGSVFGHIPVKYVKIGKPRQISEEQKEASRLRMQKMREEGAFND